MIWELIIFGLPVIGFTPLFIYYRFSLSQSFINTICTKKILSIDIHLTLVIYFFLIWHQKIKTYFIILGRLNRWNWKVRYIIIIRPVNNSPYIILYIWIIILIPLISKASIIKWYCWKCLQMYVVQCLFSLDLPLNVLCCASRCLDTWRLKWVLRFYFNVFSCKKWTWMYLLYQSF